MILGVSSALTHKDGKDWARQHKALGLGAVVFPLDFSASKEKIEEYVAAAKEEGLIIAEVGVWRNVLAEDKKEREEAINYAIGQLRLADEIGALCCVNIAGAPKGERWDGGAKENFTKETWQHTVECIQYIVDTVKPKHTKYAIEPMPWMIPTGPDEYLRLLEAINRPSVGVHLDIVNMINCPERYFFQEEFMRECFQKLKGRICSCHLKDIKLREAYTFQLEELACGKGNLNIELYTTLATAERENMPMIIEHLQTDEAYKKVLAYVQQRLGMIDH